MKLAIALLAAIALAATLGAQTANQQPNHQTTECDPAKNVCGGGSGEFTTSGTVPLSELTVGTSQSSIWFASPGSSLGGVPSLTCESSPDGFTMKNCKIGEGYTLDEAMTAIYMSMGESNRAYGRNEDNYRKAIDLQQTIIKAQKSEIAVLTKALKEAQKEFQQIQDDLKGGPRT
jgi:hypothetical protein